MDGKGVPLEITPEMRSTHLYICGSTGTGKSKLLESLIRQDITQWHQSKCGALIIDPHGSLYDGLMNWLAWNEDLLGDVPIVPIDLRRTDWTIGYNVLRPRPNADTSVIVTNFVQAMSYVFGVDGTDRTPLFAREGTNVLWPLALLKDWVLTANAAEKQASGDNWSEMKSFLQKVGSHRLIRSQTLTVSFKKPFDSLAETTLAVRSTDDASTRNSRWWRRRELNPRPRLINQPRLHA